MMHRLIQAGIRLGISIIFLSFWQTSARATAQAGNQGDFGIGAILGSPTGLSLKYWFSDKAAVDGGLAWRFSHDTRLEMHSDFLWHFNVPYTQVPEGRLPAYVGLGLRVDAGDHSDAGARIPLGLSYLISNAPLELFAEIVPVVRFAPDTGLEVDGGVGIRYYFKTGR